MTDEQHCSPGARHITHLAQTLLLKRHVTKPFPVLASKRARDITADDISDIMARDVKH